MVFFFGMGSWIYLTVLRSGWAWYCWDIYAILVSEVVEITLQRSFICPPGFQQIYYFFDSSHVLLEYALLCLCVVEISLQP